MVALYQVCYRAEHFGHITPPFIAYDWVHNTAPELRESAIFMDFYNHGYHLKHSYSGIVSHKFGMKTNISGQAFVDFVAQNPGYDLYFINPFPQDTYQSYNVWEQGEAWHPGLIEAAQQLFDDAKIPVSLADLGRNDWKTASFCNYWVANPAFWERYCGMVEPLMQVAQAKEDRYFMPTSHINTQVPIFPFIVERLLSTLLLQDASIKALSYRYTDTDIPNQCIHEGEVAIFNALHHTIDTWDAKGEYSVDQRALFRLLSRLVALIPITKTEIL